MTGKRMDQGGLIDREKPLSFRFDGKAYRGFEGDTLASALLANGVQVLGRSFKYHRPRGVWGSWVDDPNAIFNVNLGKAHLPNCPASTTALVGGMQARSVNAWPSAARDIKGGFDLLHRWLGAGFYYKTFMWPHWHFFEPMIRQMAGLGRLDMSVLPDHIADQVHDHCDLLVVGGGAAGLAAARAAAEAGQAVVLAEDHREPGGGLYRRGQQVEGETPQDWIAAQTKAIKQAGGRILTRTTAFGAYDHGLVALIEERGFAASPRLWRMRPRHTLLATGALDRPVTFPQNDLPGIMSVEAGAEYLARYGVLVGKKIAIASAHTLADSTLHLLEAAGAQVQRIDLAQGPIAASGRGRLRAVKQGRTRHQADVLLASAGWTPLVHLWRYAGGKLRWSEAHAAYLPGEPPARMSAIGAANGTYALEPALAEARALALGKDRPERAPAFQITPHWPDPKAKGRQWIDFQHDVTLRDITVAAQENYTSVEHLKRYTTLGMATDQGKTSNMAGLAAMATLRGTSIPETGTTTFRPPFVPVPIELYHGNRRGQQVNPLKRLALETRHREGGAAMCEYGGWLRPGWYRHIPPPDAIRSEVKMARTTAGVLDASPLGKVEVMGPDAEAFVDFIFYNTMRSLAPGRLRYGLMLNEAGKVLDDAVVARLGQNRFVISCSSSHVDSITTHLESWRQDGHDPDRIFVHNTTAHWTTLTVMGPKARAVVASLGLDLDVSRSAFAHMHYRETTWSDQPMRIARVSFTGDVSFEMSVPANAAHALWDSVTEASYDVKGGPIGIEALSILRAEKGYLMIGKDTDGETMPHDIGFNGPRQNKKTAFVGDRSLHTPDANRMDRRHLVGLTVARGAAPLPTGAHIVTDDETPTSLGVVTSSYQSPTLGHPIALGLLESGRDRIGQKVSIYHLKHSYEATVAAPCFYDPEGERLHA